MFIIITLFFEIIYIIKKLSLISVLVAQFIDVFEGYSCSSISSMEFAFHEYYTIIFLNKTSILKYNGTLVEPVQNFTTSLSEILYSRKIIFSKLTFLNKC